jgi:hypothetical protein
VMMLANGGCEAMTHSFPAWLLSLGMVVPATDNVERPAAPQRK